MEWEDKYAAQRVKDLEEHFTDLQLLRVTKNLQDVMKEGERDPGGPDDVPDARIN